MKTNFKKIIAFVLSITCIFSSCAIGAFASQNMDKTTTVPTVYVQGYGAGIYADKNDTSSQKIVGEDVPFLTDGVLGDMLEQLIVPLLNGITKGDYSEYNKIVVDTLSADLGRFALDKNGEPSDGSGNNAARDTNVTNKNYWYNGKYDLYAYHLVYDWRVDPFVTAAELNAYIQQVKAATGSPKVNLVGRCLGANIVLAYLAQYGYDDVNALNLYVGGLEGFEMVGALFSGQVVIDSDALDRFLQSSVSDNGDELISFLKSFVAIINVVKGLNLPIDIVSLIYDQVYTDIIPNILRQTFGTMPAFWSFVGEEYYEAARAFNFPTAKEQAEYAGLIEKIDNYYNNVTLKTEELILGAVDAGVPVYFTAKYGFTAMPICKEADLHSDGTVSVTSQSLGATSAPLGKVFTSAYIEKAKKNGTDKYISADKYIDASTALLPDHVWFVKGSRHENMPECVDAMMAQIFEATGFGENKKYVTVEDFEDYPQFVCVVNNSGYEELVPLTEENASTGSEWDVSVFTHISNLLQKTFNFVFEFISSLMEFINGITK